MNEQPKQGMGCFAKGCLTVVIAGFLLAVIVGSCGWYLYTKAVDNFTSTQSADVRIEPPPSNDQFRAADAALNRLREAVRNNQETTVAFSATDLNALVARHPDFASKRGKVRFGLVDSIMTVDLSASLDSVPLPKLRGRWFNGTARFAFNYTMDQFRFDLRSAEAGPQHVPEAIFSSSFTSAFNSSFNKSFHKSLEKDPRSTKFWDHVKTMTVQGNKLVVTTQPR